MKTWLICLVSIVWLLVTGCQHPGPRFNPYAPTADAGPNLQAVGLTNQISPELLHPSGVPFTLGPGDRIEVVLLDDPTSRTICVVGPDGKVYFHLLAGLDVWGLTLPQAKARLEQELGQYIRNQPQVSLTLRGVESRRVWVLGKLQAPGVYFMTNSLTVLEAVALAGGIVNISGLLDLASYGSAYDLADLRRSFLIRRGHFVPVDFQALIAEGDLSQNIYLEPDDFIYFPASAPSEVYVIGAVGQPRTVPYTKGLTVASAIANAAGTVKEAYWAHVAIVRGSLTQPKIAIVNYGDIITGKAQDPLLQPHDIVYVPFEPYRYLQRYGNIIMNTFVSSVAINEGIRAVSSTQIQPAGVFIPVGSGITVTPPVSGPGIISH